MENKQRDVSASTIPFMFLTREWEGASRTTRCQVLGKLVGKVLEGELRDSACLLPFLLAPAVSPITPLTPPR